MLIFNHTADITTDAFSRFSGHPEEVLFFDIETTGFSPDTSYVYLIGCAYINSGKPQVRQWFMEEAAQEKELLSAFLAFAEGFQVLVHYNGTAFDVPYIQKKCRKFHLPDTLSGMQNIDIYKMLAPIKKLLNLPDLKQKTVERFIGLQREDRFGGGDLIPVYAEFLARRRYENLTMGESSCYSSPDFQETGLRALPESPAKALLFVLLLHNREDITGLLSISSLLAVTELFAGRFSIIGFHTDTYTDSCPENQENTVYSITDSRSIAFSLDCGIKTGLMQLIFPENVSRAFPSGDTLSLCAAGQPGILTLSVPVIHDTLKYFFENHQEYYYLPMEDRAIHKSVAEFVDKAYRKKATRETCYQKKEGSFLPQPEPIFAPAFRETSKSSMTYFEPGPDFLTNGKKLKTWLISLLCWLMCEKPERTNQ